MSLGAGFASTTGSDGERSADREESVDDEEYRESRRGAGHIDLYAPEQEDDEEDQEMGAPESEDTSAEAEGADLEDDTAYEQHPSSGSTLPTPQSATFPQSATAAPSADTFAPPPPPSARATRSSRRSSLADPGSSTLPTPVGFAASKGGSNLAIAVMAPPSSTGAVNEWANSPHSNPFNYSPHSAGPQPSPQVPSLSPMTISNPYASISAEAGASNYAPSSAGSGPVTPISPYTFPAPLQSQPQLASVDGRAIYSASQFGKAQAQQSRPRSSGGFDYDANSDSHARSRIKRNHESMSGGSHGASTLAAAFGAAPPSTEKAPSGQQEGEKVEDAVPRWDPKNIARYYVPPTGPESEVEQAARMATVAASKSGLGAGAFVYKVYYMLLDPASHQYVRFSESGKSFVVFNQAGLSKHILPRHFKHSNFASFVRQLNMYSFHKVNRVGRGQTKAQLEALPSEFAHPLFEKGKPDQIDQIKRRGPDSEQQRVQRPSEPSESEAFYERRATRSVSGALMGRRYAEDDHEEDEDEESMGRSDEEYEEERKEEGPSNAAPKRSPTRPGPVDPSRNPRQSSSSGSTPGAYSPFRPTGPPSLLAAEARASYSASQDPYSTSSLGAGSAPAFARPPPHPSQSRRQQPHPQAPSHPHAHALRTIATFGPPPPASLPLPERVAILERQRAELVAALSSSQEGQAELWREVQDEKRKQVALVDLLGEVYGAVQKMNPVDLPYLFPSHVFQSRSPTNLGVDTSMSPIEPHTPAISVSPVTSHHPHQQHQHPQPHPQAKFESYQHQQLYTPQEQESSGMFASSSAQAHHPPPRLVVDPYSHSQPHSHPYSTLTTATSTPLPPSPAVASAPNTSAGASNPHLVGLGLSHPSNIVADDGRRRGAPGSTFFSFGASVRAGAEERQGGGGDGDMAMER